MWWRFQLARSRAAKIRVGTTLMAGTLVLALCSCQAKTDMSADSAAPTQAVAEKAALPGTTAAVNAADTVSVPQLAYDVRYGFAADAGGVEGLLKADQAACARAGVAACQMVSLRSEANSDTGYINKTLELRVTPQWLMTWQAGLDASVARVHGRISSQDVSSEDLSLQIVDSEAHLKNKEALRDRLADIIRHSPGKISELIEAEARLSDVQTEIDATRSALAVMRKRVATTHLTLTYQSQAVAAYSGTFAPVADAFKGALRNMMSVLAGLITIASLLLPLALVGVPAVWYGRKWLNRRSPPKAETTKMAKED